LLLVSQRGEGSTDPAVICVSPPILGHCLWTVQLSKNVMFCCASNRIQTEISRCVAKEEEKLGKTALPNLSCYSSEVIGKQYY